MSTIVTRAGKGSPLTNAELDANFTNLNTDKYQFGNAAGFATTLIGPAASANFTRFPLALSVVSNTASGIQQNESMYIGQMAEAVSVGATWASGLYGVGYTNSTGTGRGTGVTGEAHVSAAADTGAAIGVRGYSLDTHTGGINIGLYGDALSGTAAYALYMNNGDIYSAGAKTWTLGGNLTFSGAFSVAVPTLTLTNALGLAYGGTGATTAATARTNLGLAIGTNVQAWGADLDAIEALAGTSGFLKKTATNTWSLDTASYAVTTGTLAQFAATTSAQLAGVVSDETGSGSLVFATSPTLVTPILGTPQSGNFSTGTFTWPTFNQSTTGNATTATTATNIAGGAASQIHYQSAAGTTAFITAPTVTSSVLSWNGTAFAWATVGGATISDDTTTAATYYPTFATATSGTFSTAKVSSTKLTFNPSTGVLTSTTVTSSSDESLKADWQDLAVDFVDRLAQAKHGVFTRIAEGTTEAGVSAQSWQTILPQTVIKGNDGLLSVNYGGAALVSAIQLAKRLVALEATVAKLVD